MRIENTRELENYVKEVRGCDDEVEVRVTEGYEKMSIATSTLLRFTFLLCDICHDLSRFAYAPERDATRRVALLPDNCMPSDLSPESASALDRATSQTLTM